ncbi:MAG: hypothetical protein PVI23_08170 [Maricaulaceae bacterium]|jgi:hypothetical protein
MNSTNILQIGIAGVATLLAACSYDAGLRTDYFDEAVAVEPPSAPVDGGAAVVMSDEDEREIVSVSAASVVGGGVILNLPLHRIVKEAAVESFEPVLTAGVLSVSDEQAPAGQEYVVTPTPLAYRFYYEQQPSGLGHTPYVTMSVHVRVAAADGEGILDETYDVEDYPLETIYFGNVSEGVNRGTHVIARQLMSLAANDFTAAIRAYEAGVARK